MGPTTELIVPPKKILLTCTAFDVALLDVALLIANCGDLTTDGKFVYKPYSLHSL